MESVLSCYQFLKMKGIKPTLHERKMFGKYVAQVYREIIGSEPEQHKTWVQNLGESSINKYTLKHKPMMEMALKLFEFDFWPQKLKKTDIRSFICIYDGKYFVIDRPIDWNPTPGEMLNEIFLIIGRKKICSKRVKIIYVRKVTEICL